MNVSFIGDIYLKSIVEFDKTINFQNVIINLEAPFSNKGKPADDKINLFMDENIFLKTFAKSNILAANLANNHMMDYGEEAFDYTLNVLRSNNIPFFGAGSNQDNFNNPLIIEGKIAIFGYSCPSTHAVFGDINNKGSALLRVDQVINEIRNYKDDHYIVLCIHWGQEYFSFPKPEDVKKARELIDAGADLIIGHHPHQIQSHEIYKNKHIFYSIGNGIFHDDIVNSRYNGSRFTSKHRMKYGKNNRISIEVKLDTESKLISHKFLLYDSKTFKRFSSRYLDWKIKMILNSTSYNLYKSAKFFIFKIVYHYKKIMDKA